MLKELNILGKCGQRKTPLIMMQLSQGLAKSQAKNSQAEGTANTRDLRQNQSCHFEKLKRTGREKNKIKFGEIIHVKRIWTFFLKALGSHEGS